MKNLKVFWLGVLALCCIFAACKKDKTNEDPEDQLPPATQTGTNTFGCLVNGKVYIPKGYTNPYTNYRVFVDPSNNGNFDKQNYSYQNSIQMQLGINSFGINPIGIYNLTNSQIYPYYKQDVNNNTCRFISSISNFKE